MSNKNISWSTVKKLKSLNENSTSLDIFDIDRFYQFFRDLYQSNNSNSEWATGQSNRSKDLQCTLNSILDDEIKMDELQGAIKRLKTGKAAGIDQITNEYLKTSSTDCIARSTSPFAWDSFFGDPSNNVSTPCR